MTKRKTAKGLLAVFTSLVIALTFMPVIPGMGIGGADEVNAANPTKGKMTQYAYTGSWATLNNYPAGTTSDLDWEITSNGTLILGDQTDPNATQNLYMPKKQTTSRSNGQQMLEFVQPNDWPWQAHRGSIIKIVFASNVKVHGSLYQMFANMPLRAQPDFSKFDTSEATSMREMFSGAFNSMYMLNLSFKGLDVSKVTDMSGFIQSSPMRVIDLTGLDTSNVKNFNSMFSKCQWVTDIIGLENLKATPTDLGSMFYQTVRLENINFGPDFDTKEVENMSCMFQDAANVKTLDLSTFETATEPKLNNMDSMFSNMNHLQRLTGFDLNTKNVESMSYLFNNLISLSPDDIQAVVNELDTTSAVRLDGLFQNCKTLKTIDISSLKTASEPKVERLANMFRNCDNLETITGFSLNTKNVIQMTGLFGNCAKLSESSIKDIVSRLDCTSAQNMMYMFARCNQLKDIDISGLSSRYAESLDEMFLGCTNLESVKMMNPSSLKGEYWVAVPRMFMNCTKLKQVDVSALAAYKIQNYTNMFANCTSLEEIKGIDTLKFDEPGELGRLFNGMFYNCRSLKHLDLSGWNNVWRDTNLDRMFANCTSLKIDGILDWDFSVKTNTGLDSEDLATFLKRCETFKETELAKMGADNMDAYPEDLKAMVELAVNSLDEVVDADEYTTNMDIAQALQNVKAAEEAVKTQMPAMLTAAQAAAKTSFDAADAAQKKSPYSADAKKAADQAVADARKASDLAAANYSINVVYYGTESQQAKDAQQVITQTAGPLNQAIALQKLVNKKNNTLNVKGKTATIKVAKLKKKNQSLAATKVITFKNKGQGTLSYKKASGNKKVTINAKTGKVTVKKGLKKGTYAVKVNVKAAGNADYKDVTKTVTFKIKVK